MLWLGLGLVFGGDPVPDTDSWSLFNFPQRCRLVHFSISHIAGHVYRPAFFVFVLPSGEIMHDSLTWCTRALHTALRDRVTWIFIFFLTLKVDYSFWAVFSASSSVWLLCLSLWVPVILTFALSATSRTNPSAVTVHDFPVSVLEAEASTREWNEWTDG